MTAISPDTTHVPPGTPRVPADETESHWIRANDGFPIAVERFRTKESPRGYLVVAGGVGVPQGFYRRFANYARACGFDTVTFDYRGIGRSAPASLRGFRTNLREWSELDLSAVIETASREASWEGVPLYLVGHSHGGFAFGMLPNHARVRAVVTFGTGAGWHGWMPWSEQLRVRLLWHVVAPALAWWKGYLAWRMIGMGEDLPLDIYRQWKAWCRHPHYALDDAEIGADVRERMSKVRTPLLALAATDDRWSPPRSRDALLAGFSNAPIVRRDLDPAALGLGALGHMGFFRPAANVLWPSVLEWLEQQHA